MNRETEKKLDREWLDLILEAKKAGLTAEQVRNYLQTADNSKKKP